MRILLGLGAFLDAIQLVLPEVLEGFRPLMERANRFGVGAIEHVPAVTPRADQPHSVKHPQVFGDGRLGKAQADHDVADRPLPESQEIQDLPAARLGDGVECI
jgi:hypothetical protein